MNKSRFLVFAFAAFFSAAAIFVTAQVVINAATFSDVITESDITRLAEGTPPTNNWVLYTRNAGNAAFRVGPGSPPAGIGSIEFSTPTGADKAYLFNYDHVGTALSNINAISYSTYRTSGAAANQVPALNIEVDYNGPDASGGFVTLVFEPVYNTNQGAIMDGTWQAWNAYAGGEATWWSTKNIPGVCAFDCFVSWSDIVTANPDAVILGGFGINQGSGNPALTASADDLSIAYGEDSYNYNFEPFEVPANRDQCKNGGWQTLRRADGSSFKNQGDCIQYVNTGR